MSFSLSCSSPKRKAIFLFIRGNPAKAKRSSIWIVRVAWAHKIRYQPYVDEFFIVLFKSETEGDILVYSRESSKGKTEFYLDRARGLGTQDPISALRR